MSLEGLKQFMYIRLIGIGWDTLLGTNISPEKSILKMIFLFQRWDMLVSWRVIHNTGECFWDFWPYQLVQDFFGTNSSIVFGWKFRVKYFLMRENQASLKRRGTISWPSTHPFDFFAWWKTSRKLDAKKSLNSQNFPYDLIFLFLFLPELLCLFTPLKINMEHTHDILMEVWKIIFLSKWVICRFHVNLPGCKVIVYFLP